MSGFIEHNFIRQGLCAVAAIHQGRNVEDPSRDNPHVHIIVPTRTVGPEGFNKKKDREHDKRKYVKIWRKEWASAQNRAYERNGLDIRVIVILLKSGRQQPLPKLSQRNHSCAYSLSLVRKCGIDGYEALKTHKNVDLLTKERKIRPNRAVIFITRIQVG